MTRSAILACAACLGLMGMMHAAEKPLPPAVAAEQSVDLRTMRQDKHCGQIYVTCLVNRIPARMMIDTGATHTVLSQRFANAALKGVPRLDTSQMEITGNSKTTPELLLGDLVAGGTRFEGLLFIVMNLDAVNAMQSDPVDGILGMDALKYLNFVFDFENKRYAWGEAQETPAVEPLAGTRDEAGRLHVAVKSGSRKFSLLLDTGSSVTSLLKEQWEAGVSYTYTVPVADINGRREVEVGVAKAGQLQLAPHVVTCMINPHLVPSSEGAGLLGLDALRSNVLIHKADGKGKSEFFIGPCEKKD